jgi:hypothetical protein
MNNAKQPPFVSVPLELIGGLYTEALPESLPLGASPLVINCDFILGSNLQRPGKQSVYTFSGFFVEKNAGFGQSVAGTAPNEAPWIAPDNISIDTPGTYASAILNGAVTTPAVVQHANGSAAGFQFNRESVSPTVQNVVINPGGLVAGSTLFLFPNFTVGLIDPFPISGITDNSGNTYIPLGTPGATSSGTSATWAQPFYCVLNQTVPSLTINYTYVIPQGHVAAVATFLAVVYGIAAIDAPFVTASGSGTVLASPNFTTTNPDDVLFGFVICDNSPTLGSGFSNLVSGIAEYKAVVSAGTYNASFTQSPSGNWTVWGGAFKALPTLFVPFASNAAAGNLVVVEIFGDTVGTLTVEDTQGNSYALAVENTTIPSVQGYMYYTLLPVSAGPLELIIHWNGTNTLFGLIHEVSGVTFLDQTSSFAQLSQTAITPGNVTINQNELVIGGAFSFNTATVVAPTIAIQNITGNYSSAYQITAGPVATLNWTQTIGAYVALVVTFRAGVLTGDISQILEALNFPFSIPSTQEVLGLQVEIGGHQSVIPADAIISVNLVDANGDISPVMTSQLPLTTDGVVTLGLPSSTWGFTGSLANLINNPNFMVQIVASATGGEQAAFDIYSVKLKAWLTPNPGPNFNYIKTFAETGGEVLTMALGSDGVFYQEDVVNDPGVLTGVYTEIQPNSFAQSATVDDREFIAISNLQNGTDIPYTYDPPNFDRLSQVGPGAAPSATTSSSGSAILTITQYAAFPLPTGPHDFLLVSAAPSDTGTFGAPATPGNVFTIILASAQLLPTYGLPATPFTVGSNIFISGFPTINGNIVNNDPTGATAPPYYTITSVGQPITGQQSYDALTFTVNFTTYFAEKTPAGCVIQSTIATMTTAVQVPNLEVGDQFEPTGTGGAPPAGYDGTWTVLTTPNASQMLITSTELVGNVATYGFSLETGVNPAAGEAVTVTLTNNGNGIFNVTNAIITSASPGTFSIALVGADITTAAEDGTGIVFGTIFTFDAFAIIGNKSGGTVVTTGVIGVGPRQVCFSFLTRNGFLSQPSPIFKFNVVAGASNIAVARLLTGPSNVVARVVHFTAANGDQFYNISNPVSVIDNGVTTINSSTWVMDNITTNAVFSFSDGVLLTSTEIDIQGDNLFECIELGSCVAIVPYSQRIAIIGEQNKITNLLNYSFDGGVEVVTSAGGATSSYPAGWTVDPVNGSGGSVTSSPIFGFAYVISNTTGSTQAIWGMITQDAYQDEFMVAIVQASTTYSVRVTFSVPTGVPAGGNLVIDLYSPSLGRSLGIFTVPLTSTATSMKIYTGTMLTTVLAPVPNDLLIRVYATQIPTGVTITIDRLEPFPTEAPNLNTQVILSYSEEFEQFDRTTGVILATQQNQQPVVTAFPLFGVLNLVKTGSIVAVNDNPSTEPSYWNTPRVISNSVGGFGPYAVTFGIDEPNSGEEWSLIAGPAGLFIYQGSQPVKLSEDIQAVWNQINRTYGYTVWVKNDVANRRILVGVPLKALNAQGQTPFWLPAGLLTDNNPTTPNVILEMNYKQLNTASAVMESAEIHRSYSGKIIASDIVRKWSIWTIKAPCAAFIQRPDTSTPLFLGNSDNTGKIYELVDGLMEDDGSAINQIYYTAGFTPTETAQGMQMGIERFNFDYMLLLINGAGEITITVFPNSLNTPYAHVLLPNLTLPASTNGDTELPVNECGSRLFIAFSSNAVGAGFALVRVILCMHQDPWSPVRGQNS